MVANLYLVTKADAANPAYTYVEDIHAAIIQDDSGDADAVVISDLETKLQANGVPIPDGYFDTVKDITADMSTDLDIILIKRRSTEEFIT